MTSIRERAAKINFARLDEFLDECRTRGIKRVFRTWHGEKGDVQPSVSYTAWDGNEVFLAAGVDYPEIQELHRSIIRNRYGNRWGVNAEGRLHINPDNKTGFVKTLKNFGVEDVSEYRKLTLEQIRGLRNGSFGRTHKCNVLGGIVTELEIEISLNDRDASYHIFLCEWDKIAKKLEQKHEGHFKEADIQVLTGSIELV
jgi:hypothetical protein